MKYFLSIVFIFSSLLFAQSDDTWKVFDDSGVARVEITTSPESVKYMYSNPHSDSEHVASVRFINKYIDETVDSVGFRIRGNTSRDSRKKSFKVSFNSFEKGKDFYGIEKLNLNGEHNDPSIVRSKLSFDLFNSAGIISSRANHAEVYINGKYYGLYISVEHIDEEFLKRNYKNPDGNLWKCLHPASLSYISDNPDSYKTGAYDLSTNSTDADFSQLARLIRIINKTPTAQFEDSLEQVIETDNVLKYLAMNVLLGGWDSYWTLINNYYLYHNPETGLFNIIPYDYDNTFGIDWFNTDWAAVNPYTLRTLTGGQAPLASRMIAVPAYRDLYTHFIEFYRDNLFKINNWESTRIDSIRQMITASAAADTFRTKDYGFSLNDFTNSYTSSSYQNQHVKKGIKQFINERVTSLSTQLSYLYAKPVIYDFNYSPKFPAQSDSIFITASAFSKASVTEASIVLRKSDNSEVKFPLNYSPVPETKIVEEHDRYTGTITPLPAGENVGFYLLFVNSSGHSVRYPKTGTIPLSLPSSSEPIVINEFLADNSSAVLDAAGEYEDYLELYNPSSQPVLLSGRYLTDKSDNLTKWQFTQENLYIGAGEYLIVWLDEQQSQPGIHANFKLSKSGEFIALVERDGATILDSITFGEQKENISYGRMPDGSSAWDFMQPTPGSINTITTGTDDYGVPPSEFNISAYPNPFNPTTSIEYSVTVSGNVTIKLYDQLGAEAAVLLNDYMTAGSYTINFNASGLTSGVYFCRIVSGDKTKTLKLQLVK